MKALGWLVLTVALLPSIGWAETRRLAVVLGNNAGDGSRSPLHYAELDAGKFAQVMVELGGIDRDDLFLLQGRSLAQLREVLAVATARVAAWHQRPDLRVEVLFYFSGHSDGQSLELGGDRLPYAELRQDLEATGAEVRVAIVDSCHSGALLTAKGGVPGPPFEIRLDDTLTSTGQALLTSSAADEVALESSEISGSFFTHHLVSGLRGAADSSGDGVVTLAEAYEYAFAHTVTATAQTGVGSQHPVYLYALSGQGELVLSRLTRPAATIVLPPGVERALLTELRRDRVLAELAQGDPRRVAVPATAIAIKAWKGAEVRQGRVTLSEGETRTLRWEDLLVVPVTGSTAKGDLPEVGRAEVADVPPALLGWTLSVLGGGTAGVAQTLGVLPALRLGLYPDRRWGWTVGVEAGTGSATGFREMQAVATLGYVALRALGDLTVYAGPEIGAGAVVQAITSGGNRFSPIGEAGVAAGASYRLFARLSVGIEGVAPAAVANLDGKAGLVFLPGLWAGVSLSL